MSTPTTLQEAFILATAEMDNPKKVANNPAFKSKYADLPEMLSVVKPLLSAHGMAVVQSPVSDGDSIGVATKVYGYGEVLDFGAFTVPLVKKDAQGAGSAITYCRRYSLGAIFGLAQEDDDGNAASTPAKKPPTKAAHVLAFEAWFASVKELGWSTEQIKAHVLKVTGKAKSADLTAADVAKLKEAPTEIAF